MSFSWLAISRKRVSNCRILHVVPKLSVVIPTYKRPAILAECVRRLRAQTIASELEMIVVSDGHDDATSEWANTAGVKFFEIPKSQQGAARNKGVNEATGEFVLFIGDDIYLEPDACERHLAAHQESDPTAVLGFTTWDPACGITPVMMWLEKSGWQFGYQSLQKYQGKCILSDTQHLYSYTSHISLPISIAKQFPFRSDLTLYGWEDIEWGMRLRDAGIRLFYEPEAKALHHHHLEFEDSLKRMETLGRSAKEIEKIIPAFDRVPKGFKLFLYKLAAMLPTMSGKHRAAFLGGFTSSL